MAFAKAGKIASELQDKTCDLFEEMGYETIRKDAKCTNGYVHSVGHGLGLNVHEPPFMRGKDPKSSELHRFLAASTTDFIQSIIMTFALLIVLIYELEVGGDIDS